MLGRIYVKLYITMPHTKYRSFVCCVFFFHVFSIVSQWQIMMPPGPGPRAMVGRIYKEDHYTLLHTKYESSGPCGFVGDFLCFSHDAPGARPVWTPGPWLVGFIKRTTIHCYTQNMKALGLVVSEKIFLLCFSHCMSMVACDPPGQGHF